MLAGKTYAKQIRRSDLRFLTVSPWSLVFRSYWEDSARNINQPIAFDGDDHRTTQPQMVANIGWSKEQGAMSHEP